MVYLLGSALGFMLVVNILLGISLWRLSIARENLKQGGLSVGQEGRIKLIYRDDRILVSISGQDTVCEIATYNGIPRVGDTVKITSIQGCTIFIGQICGKDIRSKISAA